MSISKLVRQLLILSSLLAGGRLLAADAVKHTWSFDDDTVGQIAQGFTAEVGKWAVTDTDQGKILAQTAKNPNATFNLALVTGTKDVDVDTSVRLKAVAGELDQGGGIVWRAKDAKNYYLVLQSARGQLPLLQSDRR